MARRCLRKTRLAAIGILHAFLKGAPNISVGVPASLIAAALSCVTSQGIDDTGDREYAELVEEAARGAVFEFQTL